MDVCQKKLTRIPDLDLVSDHLKIYSTVFFCTEVHLLTKCDKNSPTTCWVIQHVANYSSTPTGYIAIILGKLFIHIPLFIKQYKLRLIMLSSWEGNYWLEKCNGSLIMGIYD